MVIDLDETLVHSSFKVPRPLEPFLTRLGCPGNLTQVP